MLAVEAPRDAVDPAIEIISFKNRLCIMCEVKLLHAGIFLAAPIGNK